MSNRDTSPPAGLYDEQDIKRREESSSDLPEDMRDRIGSTSDSLRQPVAPDAAISGTEREWEDQEASALPDAARGRNTVPSGVRQPTRDPSLSRDADFEAAGGDPVKRRGMSDGPGL
jgi:hypothetical protein